jgi:hypothetical protein
MAACRLELRGSRALAGALLLVHAAGAACVLAALPGPGGWALALLLVLLGGTAVRARALLRARHSIRAVELGPGGEAVLERADGQRRVRRVSARRHVGPWWVALPYADAPGRGLLIARDMLDRDDFRRLRLWALWGRVPEAAAGALDVIPQGESRTI